LEIVASNWLIYLNFMMRHGLANFKFKNLQLILDILVWQSGSLLANLWSSFNRTDTGIKVTAVHITALFIHPTITAVQWFTCNQT